jgi:hypothetical protein
VNPVRRIVIVLAMMAALLACGSDPEKAVPRAVEVSEFQQELLQDGDITFDEMELAVASYADCLSELGITTEADYSLLSRSYSYEFSTESADVESLLESPEGQACKSHYLDDVELVFADQFGPTEQEDAQYYEAVAHCMREAGFDVEDSKPSTLSSWYDREPATYQRCLEQAD